MFSGPLQVVPPLFFIWHQMALVVSPLSFLNSCSSFLLPYKAQDLLWLSLLDVEHPVPTAGVENHAAYPHRQT